MSTSDELLTLLRTIAARQMRGVDPLLADLARFIMENKLLHVQVGVRLLSGAADIKGVPIWEEVSAAILDNELARFYRIASELIQDGDPPASTEYLLQRSREKRGEFTSRLEAENRRAQNGAAGVTDPPTTMPLERASWRTVGSTDDGDWRDVDHMRVNLTLVNAWWPFRLLDPHDLPTDPRTLKR